MPVEMLLLKNIRIDGGTQPRVQIDLETVKTYAQYLKNEETFPAADVFFDGVNHWLADGFHRFFAHKEAKIKDMPCVVHEGTQRDAQLFSLQANYRNGLQRSNADKRKAVITMLEDAEWRKWSNRKIAEHCKVSSTFVDEIRKNLTANVCSERVISPQEKPETSTRLPEPQALETRRYTTKHGTTATMNVANIGKAEPRKSSPPDGGWNSFKVWGLGFSHFQDEVAPTIQIECRFEPDRDPKTTGILGVLTLKGTFFPDGQHVERIAVADVEHKQSLADYARSLADDLYLDFITETGKSIDECTPSTPECTSKAPVAPVKAQDQGPTVFDTALVEAAAPFSSGFEFLDKGTLRPFSWDNKTWMVFGCSVETKPPQRVLEAKLVEIIPMGTYRAQFKETGCLSYSPWLPGRTGVRGGFITSDEKWYLTDTVLIARRADLATIPAPTPPKQKPEIQKPGMPVLYDCEVCDTEGEISDGEPCPACHGEGILTAEELVPLLQTEILRMRELCQGVRLILSEIAPYVPPATGRKLEALLAKERQPEFQTA